MVSQNNSSYNNVYRFSGKALDEETGLSYFGARYYDSKLSIWLSVDPLAEKYMNFSPYVYCLNNPINLIDPDGRDIEPARNQAGTIQEAVNQWRENGLRTVAEIMTFTTNKNIDGNGTNAIRYVYTKKSGWIDLQHYAGVQKYGKSAMDCLEPASGDAILQSLIFGEGANDSYYSYEDLPSNAFSSEVDINDLEGENLYNAILIHFDKANAENPENAPNYKQIPEDDGDRKRLPEKTVPNPDGVSPNGVETKTIPDKSKLKTGNYIPQNRTSKPYNLNDFDPANTSIEKNN